MLPRMWRVYPVIEGTLTCSTSLPAILVLPHTKNESCTNGLQHSSTAMQHRLDVQPSVHSQGMSGVSHLPSHRSPILLHCNLLPRCHLLTHPPAAARLPVQSLPYSARAPTALTCAESTARISSTAGCRRESARERPW